jgi:hypothetical protein
VSDTHHNENQVEIAGTENVVQPEDECKIELFDPISNTLIQKILQQIMSKKEAKSRRSGADSNEV